MSYKVPHFIVFDTPAGIHDDLEAAVKDANAIIRQAYRICEKHNFSCMGTVAVSQNDSKISSVKVGYRGKKEYASVEDDSYVPPHIHAVFLCSAGASFIKYLCKYFRKKKKYLTEEFPENKIYHQKYCDTYLGDRVKYCFLQATRLRTVVYNPDGLEKDLVTTFCDAAERYNLYIGGNKPVFGELSKFYFKKLRGEINSEPVEVFTKTDTTEELENPVVSRAIELLKPQKTLQCNIITYNTCKSSKINKPSNITHLIQPINHLLSFLNSS